MSFLSDQDMAVLAAWHIGVDVPADELREAIKRVNPLDEEQSVELGRAVAIAAQEYRRDKGEWPSYQRKKPTENYPFPTEPPDTGAEDPCSCTMPVHGAPHAGPCYDPRAVDK